MLINFRVTNFRSFNESQELSMISGKVRRKIYVMRKAILQKITKWILESETPDIYIELVSEEALEKLLPIIIKRYRKGVRFFGMQQQRDLFEKIANMLIYGYKLTKEEEEFVWKGKVDNWIEKDLLELGDYRIDTIQRFKDNVEKIKKDISFRIALMSISFLSLSGDINDLSLKINSLQSNMPGIDFIDIATVSSKFVEINYIYAEIATSSESFKKWNDENISKLNNIYDMLRYIQTEIGKSMEIVMRGIDDINDNISKYECLGDAEHAKVRRLEKQRNDLTNIQQKLGNIQDQIAPLLPKDESPVEA